jgi:hypothetical protein
MPHGVRYWLRQFPAAAVKEHMRAQIEDGGGAPELTKNEVELVRFLREGQFDWDRYLAGRSKAG